MFNATITNMSEIDLVRECNEEFRSQVMPVTAWFGLEIMFGIIGNLLTMYVFFFHYKMCNFRLFVLSLAWTDFISCLTTIPAEMVSQMYWFDYHFPAVCKTKVFFNQYTICSEAASLAIIAIDRHRKVCNPFGWQISYKAAFYVCVGIHIASALLSIPTPISWGVTTKEHVYKARNITVSLCEKDAKYEHTPFPFVTATVNRSIVAIPLLVMFVLYILVAKRLIRARNYLNSCKIEEADGTAGNITDVSSNHTSSGVTSQKLSLKSDTNIIVQKNEKSDTSKSFSEREESNTNTDHKMNRVRQARRKTMIGLYLTIIFIVTMVLYRIQISVVATGVLDRLHGGSKAVFFFFLRLYFINHVINPILYGILDPQFRRVMLRLKQKICGCPSSSRK